MARFHQRTPTPPVLWALLLASGLIVGLSGGLPAWGQTAGEATAATGPLPAGSVIEYHPQDQTLTVHVRSFPLRELLSTITEQTGVRFRLLQSANQLEDRLVTRSFDQMPLERAITQLLGRTNSAMVYNSQMDSTGGEQFILAEVQIVGIGDQVEPIIASSSRTSRSISNRPTVNRSPPPVLTRPPLSPEQLEARQAAAQQRREERAEGKAGKQQRRQSQGVVTESPTSPTFAESDGDSSNQSGQANASRRVRRR